MSTITSEIRLRVRADGEKVLADLGTKLNSLANQATLSSNNFKGLAEELKKVQQTTIQSARNIKDYSASWRELASSVDISSKEFKQATAEAARLDAQLAKIQGTSVRTAAAVQTAMRGPVTGGTAGAGIMGRPAEALEPYSRLGFETLDPEFWRERQRNAKDKQGNILGQLNQPQFLDYGATDKALGNLQGSLQNVRDIEDRSRLERLELQEKYNNLEIKKQDQHAAKVLAKDRENADIGGRDFMQRLENREKQKSQRRQRFAGAAQTAGAVAASGIFGGPEGLVGAGIGAVVGGPMGAAAGGAIGAQVGMLRQAIGETATYASEITKLNIALKGITKTSQEYSDAQNAINSISKSLNVPIKEATSSFTKLSASVIGAGGNVNDAEIVFRGITTAIKGTGGGAAEVQGALLAMSQVFSKGKVSAEELSGQLGERLPGAVTAFAKATGRSLPQLQKDLENGVVGLNDVIKFAIALEAQYSNSAKNVASSSEESGARMTVALDEVKLAVGSAFQPIGSKFQESITQAAKVSIVGVKMIINELKVFNKEIEKAFGKENVQSMGENIKFLFTTMVDEASKVLNPMHQIASLLKRIYDTTPQGKLANAGVEATYTDAQGNVYDTATGRFLRKGKPDVAKPPTKFEEPKGKDDDTGAKKAAKEAAELKNLLEVNRLQQKLQRMEIFNLEVISTLRNKLNNILATETEETKKNNIENVKALRLQIILLEGQNDANQLAAGKAIALQNLSLEPNKQIAQAKRQNIEQNFASDVAKLKLKVEDKRRDVLNGITKENTKQTESTTKELSDSKRLFLVLEDQLAIARAITPEQKIRLESQARINELDREGAALAATRTNETVKQQDLLNLRSQKLLEELNLQTQLAALQPKSPLQEFVKQASAELQNLEGVAVTVSQGIGDAVGNSVSSGIQGLVEGTANAQQIFSDFLKSIGQILIQEGAKMIATYTAIAIAKSLAGLFGGGGGNMGGKGYFDPSSGLGVAGPNFGLAKGGVFSSEGMQTFANGGLFSNSIVNSPTLFKFANGGTTRTGLMGEAGPEAIMPLKRGADGKLGVAADITGAMARYQRQGGGSAGESDMAFASGGSNLTTRDVSRLQQMSGPGEGSDTINNNESNSSPVLMMNFETTRILGQDWVSTEQLQAAMKATEKRATVAGAKAGAAQVTSKLQQSPSYRRQVGLR